MSTTAAPTGTGASPTSSEVPARPAPDREPDGLAPATFNGPGWVLVGRTGDVPDQEGRRVHVAGHAVAVFRLPEGFAAVDAACPHLGGPLQDGIVAERCVTCPLHGRRFDLVTGRRLDAPDVEGLGVHDVAVRGDELWVRPRADRPAP